MGQRFGDQVNCNMMYMNCSADLYDNFETQEITLINNNTSTSAAAPCLCFEIIIMVLQKRYHAWMCAGSTNDTAVPYVTGLDRTRPRTLKQGQDLE